MATIGELILSLRGDARDWQTATSTAEAALRKLVKEAEKAGQDLSKFNAQTINLLKGWDNAVGDAARNVSTSLEPVKQGLVDQGKALSTTQKGINTLAVEELNAIAINNNLKKSLDQISSSAWVLTMGLKQLGTALTTAFTVPLAGIATLSIKTFADWETGTKNLQASAGMTTKEAEKMTASFRELAMVMPLNVKELQEISRAAAEAGVSTENLEKYTIAIGKLVTISEELTLENAAEALISVSRAFGIAENNVERVGSVIRKMAKESRGGMDDFTAALLRAIPAASILSLSFEDVSAMLAAIIPVSGSATRAGTELSTMFDQMSQNLPKLAGQMGITAEELKRMISKDAVGTLQQYIEQLGVSEDQVEKNAAILEVFGATGAKALRGLISQYDVFLERQDEAKQAFIDGTELTKDYEIASDTLTNTFKRFQSAVLEVAKVIGDDLNKVIGPVLEQAIKLVSLLASIWVGIPEPIKEVVITLAAVLAVLGPIILAFNTIVSIGAGLITSFTRLNNIVDVVKGAFAALSKALGIAGMSFGAIAASAGKFILIAVAVVAAVVLIYKALDDLFGITSKIKDAIGFTEIEDRFKEIQEKVKGSLGAIDDSFKAVGNSFKETQEDIKNYASGMAILAREWGDNIMLGFLQGFTQADFTILNDNLKVFESYFEILEKQGKLSTQEVLDNMLLARRALAQAISEVKEFGEVSIETQRRITALIGSARTKDVISQIMAEIRVTQIQETIDALNEEIKNRRDALKKETAIIDKAIKEAKGQYEDQIEEEEELVKALEKRKKELQKTYKAQIKAFEATVDTAKEERDLLKERLEVIKESNDAIIDNLKEQKDALQENVNATRDALSDLRDLRKDEVDAAEGMLDYAKMNLEAARNQLKKEQALGHDEWDASFRAAKERTEAAEDQVDLAYANYIKTKQLYTKEEKALKSQLKEQEKAVDNISDQIKAAEKTAKEQEKLYEAQIKVAEKTLKSAQDALDAFKDSYNEQTDLIQEEIDIHKERISDFKEARDAILDKLNDEKDALQDKYEKEIDILEERVNGAQSSLNQSKKLLEAQKGINDQWLAIERERLQAAQGMTGGTQFPGIAGIGTADVLPTLEGLDEVNEKLDETQEKINELEDTAPSVFERIGESWKAGSWIDDFNEAIKNFNPADKIGKIIRETDWGKLFGGIWKGLEDAVLSIDWKGIKDGLVKAIIGINWIDLADVLLQLAFPPYYILRAVLSAFGIDWNKIKDSINEGIKSINWGSVLDTLILAIFPPYALLEEIITKVKEVDWNQVKDQIISLIKEIDFFEAGREIARRIGDGIRQEWDTIKNAAKDTMNAVYWGIQEKWNDFKEWGKDVIRRIGDGFWDTYNSLKNTTKDVLNAVYWGLQEKWNDFKEWGKYIIWQIGNGLWDTYNDLKNTIKDVSGAVYWGLREKWNDFKEWGKSISYRLADGIMEAYDAVKNAANYVANTVRRILGWYSPPKEGPMHTGDKWGPNMMKTIAEGILRNMPMIEGAVNTVGETIGQIGSLSPVVNAGITSRLDNTIAGINTPQIAAVPVTTSEGQKTININPGMLIATQGEIRSFARMLQQYLNTEEARRGGYQNG